MNLRLAKKILQCRTSLHKNYFKVLEAREIIRYSDLDGWILLPLNRETFERMKT